MKTGVDWACKLLMIPLVCFFTIAAERKECTNCSSQKIQRLVNVSYRNNSSYHVGKPKIKFSANFFADRLQLLTVKIRGTPWGFGTKKHKRTPINSRRGDATLHTVINRGPRIGDNNWQKQQIRVDFKNKFFCSLYVIGGLFGETNHEKSLG